MSNFLNRIFFNFTPLKRSQKVQPSEYPSTIVYGNIMFTPYQIIIDTTDTLTTHMVSKRRKNTIESFRNISNKYDKCMYKRLTDHNWFNRKSQDAFRMQISRKLKMNANFFPWVFKHITNFLFNWKFDKIGNAATLKRMSHHVSGPENLMSILLCLIIILVLTIFSHYFEVGGNFLVLTVEGIPLSFCQLKMNISHLL